MEEEGSLVRLEITWEKVIVIVMGAGGSLFFYVETRHQALKNGSAVFRLNLERWNLWESIDLGGED